MASNITNYIRNMIVDQFTGKGQSYWGVSKYIGLSSTAPTQAGGNITEPTTGGYKRVLIGTTNQSGTYKMSAAADGESISTEEIYFPESTGTWGAPLTHYVLFNSDTASSVSNVLAYGTLKDDNEEDTSITVTTSNRVVLFRPGEFKISMVDVES